MAKHTFTSLPKSPEEVTEEWMEANYWSVEEFMGTADFAKALVEAYTTISPRSVVTVTEFANSPELMEDLKRMEERIRHNHIELTAWKQAFDKLAQAVGGR